MAKKATQEVPDIHGTISWKQGGKVSSSGDTKFDLVRDSAKIWGEVKEGKRPNNYVPIPIGDDAEFRHTLRSNGYGTGMEDFLSFDIEYRIGNIVMKSKTTSTPSAASADGPVGVGSFDERKAFFLEVGDAKALTSLLRERMGIALKDAKKYADDMIEAHSS